MADTIVGQESREQIARQVLADGARKGQHHQCDLCDAARAILDKDAKRQ